MLKLIHRKKAQKGFTLIELLVVIAIIGVLATIVLVSLNTARSKARDTRRVADLRQVAIALEFYYDANDGYIAQACGSIPAALAPTYIGAIPTDPGTTSYQYGGTATNYILAATLENSDNDALGTDYDGSDPVDCTCATNYCIRP